jgi:crotonobetainyl-CoA:carnitine CoA-transferase CaiB-like acyl-CoA transferase
MVRPLEGIRVLDLTRLLPGAYATLLLADLGADVVKIEDPRGGDGMRSLPTAGRRNYFALLNRHKRSVTLDLRSPEAARVFDALCANADVVIESFRPSTARRLGVDGETLRRRYPHLVCASISGFGQAGPYAERAAHDINYQALAGLLMRSAGADLRQSHERSAGADLRQPRDRSSGRRRSTAQMPGPLVGDIGAAMQAAMRILAALLLRERTGDGSVVDVAIHDAALAWAMLPTTGELANACYTMYETADGQWLALGALEPKFWKGFCDRLGRPDLAPLQHAQGDERAWVEDEVRRVMIGLTRDEWLARFASADVCLTPVYTPGEAAADPHARSRADLFTARPGNDAPLHSAPALGADTDEVLEAAGIDAAERARLRAAGVL